MNKNKIGTLFLVSTLALAGVGISYSGFIDEIFVSGYVETGTVELVVHNYSGTWVWKVWGCDNAPADEVHIYSGYEENLPDVSSMFPGCNIELVAWAKGRDFDPAIDDYKPDGSEYDAVIQFWNLFPCIDFWADIVFHYEGSIPAKIIKVEADWVGEETMLPTGQIGDWLDYLEGTGDLYHNLGASVLPPQIHYCDYLKYDVKIHIPQDNLFQGLTGTGYLNITVRQWNDECDQTGNKEISLPDVPVTMIVSHPWTIPPSYFKTTLSNVPAGDYNVENGDYVGWCCDLEHSINPGQLYTVTLYSSYDPTMPSYFADEDWDKVNYLINHKVDHEPYTWEQMQDAIWYFIDGGYSGTDPKVWEIINDADVNGDGFIPQTGQWIAVICDAGPNIQHSFIEVDP